MRAPGSSRILEATAALGRRQVLLALAGAVAGGAFVSGLWLAGGGRASSPAPARRGTLAWALAMRDAPDEELLMAAGDLERVSSEHRHDERLVPCFERLLDVVLASRHEAADIAGCCAVRSLLRHGRPELVRQRARAILRCRHLKDTVAAAEAVLDGR